MVLNQSSSPLDNHAPKRGIFISFEGADGVGKTTQIDQTANWLEQQGHSVIKTREPGGTQGAERLRDLLKYEDGLNLSGESETLLLYAARLDHVEKIIKPALAKGTIVLCDRFHDSTLAYQGGGGKVDAEWIMKLHLQILGNFIPDLTFLLMVDEDRTSKRIDKRAELDDKFERAGEAYHHRVRQVFLQLASLSPQRIHVIDGSQSIDAVAGEIQTILTTSNLLPLHAE